jgi:hypothetical protein
MADLIKKGIPFQKNMPRSETVERFIKNGGVVKVISPEETAKTLRKQSGGYFKGQSVMGPSKKKGKTS